MEENEAIKALKQLKQELEEQMKVTAEQQVHAVRCIAWLMTESRWWACHYATRLIRESPYSEELTQPNWLEYH